MARVPTELSETQLKKVVALVKKFDDEEKDASKFDAIQDIIKGISRQIAARYLYEAEVVADPKLKFKLSAATYKKAKADGLREERIAARTGKTLGELKAFLAANNVGPIYAGKGRRFDGSAPNGTTTKKAATAAKKETAAKRGPGRPKGSTSGKVKKRSGLKPRPSRT